MPRVKEKKYVEARDLPLEEWLKYAEQPEQKRKVLIECSSFMSDNQLNEYLSTISKRTDSQIKNLLRSFLPMGGAFGSDVDRLKYYTSREDVLELWEEYEHVRRLFQGLMGNKRHVWEGLSWILDLLPQFPTDAIAAINSYVLAHAQLLPDGRLNGLFDSIEVIRSKYIEQITDKNFTAEITPRDFEFLVASLFPERDWEVIITPPTRDGGCDIIATKSTKGATDRVLIECKMKALVVTVEVARALVGILGEYKATRGVIVTSSRFTRPAIEFAKSTARLELIDRQELCRKLNMTHGPLWLSRLSSIVTWSRARAAKIATISAATKHN